MQRCCTPPPPPRKFEIKFALRRIGILAGFAVCILVLAGLAANDAQAQTPTCPNGQRVVFVGEANHCYSNAKADIADACEAAGWGLDINGLFGLICQIPSIRYIERADRPGVFTQEFRGVIDTGLSIGCGIDTLPPNCVDMFGDPPQFPESTDSNDQKNFWANCSQDGTIPGGIPATINNIGATECTCGGAGGHVGDWPDCTCIAGQGVLANGTCGVCPSGQGVLADGTCGACPGGQEGINGVCQCPAGTSNIRSDDDPRCYSDALAEVFNKCNASGYGGTELSVPADPYFKCDIKNLHGSFGPASSGRDAESPNCTFPDAVSYLHGGTLDARLCSEIFGADFNFPQKPTDGSDPRYVFSCDPDGSNGLIPATINTIGATECACAIGGQTLQDDVCACPVGHIIQDGVCAACPVGHIPQDGVCAACPAGHIALNGACAVCPAGQIVLNNACAVCADGEIVYRGVCTDASVLELSGKALTLYNLLVARVTLGNVNLPAYLYSLEQFQQGILDRHNGVANYLGDLLQYETSGLYGYRPFLIDSQTAGFGNYRLSVSGEIDRILSQIPVHTSGSSSAPFGSQACQNAGWIFSADDGGGSCGVPLTLSSGAVSNRCHLSGSDSPQCSAVFGSTVNYFPSPTLSADGATLRFVYNCDLDGSKGLIPATINTIGATECACFITGAPAEDGGACACPPGEGALSDTGICGVCPAGETPIGGVCLPDVIMDQCVTVGWSFSAADGGSCGVLLTVAGGESADRCYLSGDDSPQCEAVFGSTVNYFPAPVTTSVGATLRFVYNCDPDGDRGGRIPARANTIAATECGCESNASHLRPGACVPDEEESPDFGGIAQKALCGAFGGTVRIATGGAGGSGSGGVGGSGSGGVGVCSGMDANDTFCILDAEEVDGVQAFPCRGLFKHLRSCNLEFNRPALNPFFCGERCPGENQALGSGCDNLGP